MSFVKLMKCALSLGFPNHFAQKVEMQVTRYLESKKISNHMIFERAT